MSEPILQVSELSKTFHGGGVFRRTHVKALTRVSFDLAPGEIVALVGESGSGKSTLARCVAKLEKPDSGTIALNGTPINRVPGGQLAYRAQVQMVFQDPFGSLNPVHRVEHFLKRSLAIHKVVKPADMANRLAELMTTVGLEPDMLHSYPHELSGGQRQRVAIARALAVEPQVILADEPTSMLDVSVRIGVLNLMKRLRDERDISMLYITHDLASARYLADRIAVMFAGEIVESGESLSLLTNPAHPYTELLTSAVPDPSRTGSFNPMARAELRRRVLASTSCPFDDGCSGTEPVRHQVGDPSEHHWVRCHLYRPTSAAGHTALTPEELAS